MTVTKMETRTQPERITIGLTRRNSEDLAALHEETGMSKTDLLNRALAVYKLVHDRERADMALGFISTKADGSPEYVEIVRLV